MSDPLNPDVVRWRKAALAAVEGIRVEALESGVVGRAARSIEALVLECREHDSGCRDRTAEAVVAEALAVLDDLRTEGGE